MNHDEIERSLEALGQNVEVKESPQEAAMRRARITGQLRGLNAELVRQRSARRARTYALASAAAVALCFGSYWAFETPAQPKLAESGLKETLPVSAPLRVEAQSGQIHHKLASQSHTLNSGTSMELGENAVLETLDHASARVEGGRGLDIEVRPQSQVAFRQIPQNPGAHEINLLKGAVHCSVDPSGSGMKLAVTTADARVVVKGTIFSVSIVERDGESHTCVEVQRGLVSVTRGKRTESVAQGQSSGCAAHPVVESSETTKSEEQTQVKVPIAPQLSTAKAPAQQETSASRLSIQNGLFARGLAAEREGRLDTARKELTLLLQKYPDTPLRHDVELALGRIVRSQAKSSQEK